MLSDFRETKLYFETMFNINWTTTPIHFVGEEFDSSSISEWINLYIQPLSGALTGLSNSTQTLYSVYVTCWAETDGQCLELCDAVIAFVSLYTNQQYRIKRYEVNDKGWDNSNHTYTTLSFDVSVYKQCFVAIPQSCNDSVGGIDGTEFSLYGFWFKDCIIFKG